MGFSATQTAANVSAMAASAAPSAIALPTHAEVATLALDEQGSIRDCCAVAENWFGYRRDALLALRAADLLPDLAGTHLTHDGQVNPRLAFLSRCGVRFDAKRHSGERFACLLFFNKLNNRERPPLLVLIRAVDGLARATTAYHAKREMPALHRLTPPAPRQASEVQRRADLSFPS